MLYKGLKKFVCNQFKWFIKGAYYIKNLKRIFQTAKIVNSIIFLRFIGVFDDKVLMVVRALVKRTNFRST